MNKTDKKNIDEFVKAVRDYCTLIENFDEFETKEFFTKVSQSFSKLNYSVLALPEIPVSDVPSKDIKIDFESILEGMRIKFGEVKYLETFNPFKNKESIPFNVMYDIIEVYRDIKADIIQFDEGDEDYKQDALWELQFGYGSHWGHHLATGQRVLFYYLYEHYWRDS